MWCQWWWKWCSWVQLKIMKIPLHLRASLKKSNRKCVVTCDASPPLMTCLAWPFACFCVWRCVGSRGASCRHMALVN